MHSMLFAMGCNTFFSKSPALCFAPASSILALENSLGADTELQQPCPRAYGPDKDMTVQSLQLASLNLNTAAITQDCTAMPNGQDEREMDAPDLSASKEDGRAQLSTADEGALVGATVAMRGSPGPAPVCRSRFFLDIYRY